MRENNHEYKQALNILRLLSLFFAHKKVLTTRFLSHDSRAVEGSPTMQWWSAPHNSQRFQTIFRAGAHSLHFVAASILGNVSVNSNPMYVHLCMRECVHQCRCTCLAHGTCQSDPSSLGKTWLTGPDQAGGRKSLGKTPGRGV